MNRRQFAKQSAVVAAGATIMPRALHIISKRALSGEIIGHGDFRYRVDTEWGNLDPMAHPVKNCHEMVQDRRGRLIMITDEVKNNILIYDKSGKLLDSWGTSFPDGHGLTLSDEGDAEYLWICDNGFGGNPQVVKTTLDGREVLRLPHPRDFGEYGQDDKFYPTETAVAPNGDVYVADGYGSQWILQFSAGGEFIRKFGGRGDEDAQFSTAHGVCVDQRGEGDPTLIITSRTHNAFKRFSMEGQYLETLFLPGAFVCRAVIDDDMLYSGVCWSRLRYLNLTPRSGFVTILNGENRVVSNPGGTAPEYRDGKLQMMVQQESLFHHCHDVCIDEDKNIYVCQWNAEQTYPIRLERV
ncbi:MAG: 6-bladed beta-propeller [Planctomycetes bacterium]|nr:6-bladed beta-propeller [Planctomycetota bacterium]